MRRVRWIAVLVAAVVLGVPAAASANILPVGQWDLNEGTGAVARNDVWSGGPGALSGGVTWTSGRFQRGLAFDGSNGGVQVTDSPALEGASITVSAWVNNQGSPGAFRYIVTKGGNNCCTGSYGLYTGAQGGLEFYVASSQTTYVISPDAGTGVWDGSWHNVIGTFDGSTVRLYVDGREVGTGSPDSTPITYGMPTSNDLVIGNYPWCAGLAFSGSIDEVKVFNRALGATEIHIAYLASHQLPSWSPFDLVL